MSPSDVEELRVSFAGLDGVRVADCFAAVGECGLCSLDFVRQAFKDFCRCLSCFFLPTRYVAASFTPVLIMFIVPVLASIPRGPNASRLDVASNLVSFTSVVLLEREYTVFVAGS